MAVKKYNPTSPASRYKTGYSFEEITSDKPYKPLTEPLISSGGRNNKGKLTSRHRGGDIKNLTGSLTSRDPRMESLPESNLSNMIQIGLLELPSFAMPMAKGIIFWLQLA